MPLMEAAPDALARIYAAAVFDLGKGAGGHGGQSRVEEILGELEDLLELARSDAKFGEFLGSLILPARKRSASLKKILDGRVGDLTLRFLLVLNEKERLGHLPSIVAALEQMVQQAFGRIEVDVYTAAAIDPDEVRAIRDRLQAILKREPVVHAYVEPSMIGGLKLQIGDQLIDASVETRLRKMRDNLAQTGGSALRSKADGMIEG